MMLDKFNNKKVGLKLFNLVRRLETLLGQKKSVGTPPCTRECVLVFGRRNM